MKLAYLCFPCSGYFYDQYCRIVNKKNVGINALLDRRIKATNNVLKFLAWEKFSLQALAYLHIHFAKLLSTRRKKPSHTTNVAEKWEKRNDVKSNLVLLKISTMFTQTMHRFYAHGQIRFYLNHLRLGGEALLVDTPRLVAWTALKYEHWSSFVI